MLAMSGRGGGGGGGGGGSGFRRPESARQFGVLAEIEELIGERGEGLVREYLCRWRGNYSARPRWVLLSQLRQNPSFNEAFEAYRHHGEMIIRPMRSDGEPEPEPIQEQEQGAR